AESIPVDVAFTRPEQVGEAVSGVVTQPRVQNATPARLRLRFAKSALGSVVCSYGGRCQPKCYLLAVTDGVGRCGSAQTSHARQMLVPSFPWRMRPISL